MLQLVYPQPSDLAPNTLYSGPYFFKITFNLFCGRMGWITVVVENQDGTMSIKYVSKDVDGKVEKVELILQAEELNCAR